MRHLIISTIVLLPLLLMGYADESRGETYTDSDSLITFAVPETWELKSESHGMRFVRADKPKERTTLMIAADPHDPDYTLEHLQDIRRAQIRQQEANVVIDVLHTINEFSAWESAFQTTQTSRTQTAHSFYLFSDEVRVEIKLIAWTDLYPDYVEDLKSVTESVQANSP